jgi:hypothetical protein
MFVSEWKEDGADLERCGGVIGGFVVCEFLCLLEDSLDGCKGSWDRMVKEMRRKRIYLSCSC